ncbi:MAG: hypothetical protein ACXACD_08725 [Candidatus Thorarchaeota archaeon]|jgi:hypothetical protein
MAGQSRWGIIVEARGSLADYFVLFAPATWKEPMERLKLILQASGNTDWEALKGHMLIYLDEVERSEDRVATLEIVERAGNSMKKLHETVSPAEWYLIVNNLLLAAHFRASRTAATKEDE